MIRIEKNIWKWIDETYPLLTDQEFYDILYEIELDLIKKELAPESVGGSDISPYIQAKI